MFFVGTYDAFAAWRTGTAMSSARQEFTMITLGNGKTLAAGGWNGSAYTSTAELYDPATGLWTATGSMNGIRGGESEAVLLQDGRVLLVGGSGAGGGVNVEIYDPVAGTWSVTGSMNVSRRQFSINVLNDGRVLVAGSSACVTSAEIYNPATGTWTLTGSMINGRRYNVGALLTNGNVITVNGRIHDCTALNLTISETTELYNVATGTWSSTGSTVIERQKHRIVTLLNGTPMVVGGGQDNLDTTPIAELYDVNTGTWTATGSMTAKKADFEMKVLPSGKVIMAGGTTLGSSTNQTNTSEIYDPVAGTWSSAGTFTTVRYFHRSAVLADGSFMIGGGNSGSTALSSVNIYSIPPVSTAQAASSITATTATLNGTITHTGGQTPTVRGFNYGTTTGYGSTTTENGSFSTGAYTANITGLTCGTTYHYRTYATNSEGTDYSSDATFTTGSCDSTAPTVTSISSDKTNGSYKAGDIIDIDVTFSESVTSTGNVTVTLETGATDRTCTFTVSNSSTGTCNYTVQAGDTSSDLNVNTVSGTIADQASNTMTDFAPSTNLAANKALVIDTTNPTISEVTPVTNPTADTTPDYTFTTDEAGTISYGGSCSSGTTSATLGSNTITFTSLSDGTYSNCTITVTDTAGNASSTLSVTSFTVDATAPALSSISSNPSTTNVTITWTSDEDSSSSVSYGSTDSYGSTTTEIDTTTRVTSHSVTISGLSCASNYHYKVISKDLASNTSIDNDNTFTTTACPIINTGGPAPIWILQSMNTANQASLNNSSGQGSSTTTFNFSKNLQSGFKDLEVKELQKFLNSNGFTVSKSGAGSNGKETVVFGQATKSALIKFQKANNIRPAVGYFGPITKKHINNLIKKP